MPLIIFIKYQNMYSDSFQGSRGSRGNDSLNIAIYINICIICIQSKIILFDL